MYCSTLAYIARTWEHALVPLKSRLRKLLRVGPYLEHVRERLPRASSPIWASSCSIFIATAGISWSGPIVGSGRSRRNRVPRRRKWAQSPGSSAAAAGIESCGRLEQAAPPAIERRSRLEQAAPPRSRAAAAWSRPRRRGSSVAAALSRQRRGDRASQPPGAACRGDQALQGGAREERGALQGLGSARQELSCRCRSFLF